MAAGLVVYWNVGKAVRTDALQEGQKTQREAAAQPDIAPRSSLVVLPFANLNNDPEQDYFADGIATDLTTDLAQSRLAKAPRLKGATWVLCADR
jgi:adenylate cyclase